MSTDDEKISNIYREAEAPGPSKTLDDVILAASRDAVETPAQSTAPFTAGWPALASIAAIIVITIILVPTLQHQQQQAEPDQLVRKKSSPAQMRDETGFSSYSSTETANKMMGAPTPASKAVMQIEQNLLLEERAMPSSSSVNSRSAGTLSTSEAPLDMQEQDQFEPVVSAVEASRMRAADSAPFAVYTPEMWEVKIARLIAEGNIEQAKAEIKKLEQHYPEHPINPALLKQFSMYYE